MPRLFGTDGVRGVAGTELTAKLAFELGQAGAAVLAKHEKHNPKVIIGRDTRVSGDMLSAALAAGICSVGAEAIDAGVLPTPAIAYLTKKYAADAGAVISASHNSAEFNGIKFFNKNGYKLDDNTENEIEGVIRGSISAPPLASGVSTGRCTLAPCAAADYISFAAQTCETDISGMRVALDCANGAGYKTGPMALSRLGADVLVIHNEPNGVNINEGCGSTNLSKLREFTLQNRCEIGLAFDGDADRLLAVDERGNEVDGDKIMAICALDMKTRGKLEKNTLVATVMSNLGLFLMGGEQGINILKTKVGDRYVLEEMMRGGYSIGGEQSGHIIFPRFSLAGDGLITAIQLLGVVKRSGRTLSSLGKIMNIMPQVLYNARVKAENKHAYAEDLEIAAEIKRLELLFADAGRVLIRPSGTEPLVRVMLEGADRAQLEREAGALGALIERRLG